MERILRVRNDSHLEENGLILNNQLGFDWDRSCLTTWIEFFEYLTEVIVEGGGVDVVYLTFSKAFDKVRHDMLIQTITVQGTHDNLIV